MVARCVESGEPLMLAHDDGVYLCVDSIRTPEGPCACAYARGCDPRPVPVGDAEWFETARRLVGGDDFGERINVKGATALTDALRRGDRLVIRFTKRTISLFAERVVPPSTTPEAASGRGNGSTTSARTPERNSDMSTTKKKSSKKAKPSGERLKQQALKEIADRLAGGKQDHEVPTAKEIANTPHKAGASKSKSAKAPKGAARKRVSALDAAAQVLESAKEPMTSGALIDAMAKRDLWKSPGGKTPAATLYAAIIREIKAKGKDARFKKTDRGLFVATGKKAG